MRTNLKILELDFFNAVNPKCAPVGGEPHFLICALSFFGFIKPSNQSDRAATAILYFSARIISGHNKICSFGWFIYPSNESGTKCKLSHNHHLMTIHCSDCQHSVTGWLDKVEWRSWHFLSHCPVICLYFSKCPKSSNPIKINCRHLYGLLKIFKNKYTTNSILHYH